MLAKEIWDTLSVIDVNKHTEKKGRFTYLSWTWAWAEFSKYYPNCNYKMSDRTFPDGTMEVYCKMKVFTETETVKRNMWLPVLNNSNKAIPNPNAFDVNNAKMRCLVKCLAFYGLGHYIYSGESFPQLDTEAIAADWIAKIDASADMDSLQLNFKTAYQALGNDRESVALITAKKDAKKRELSQ
jgi:hypothetical protein|tara:strand:+ start:254 stop:805 length:552 start_codon:yes stop_codon:yes gene_type:complete